MMKKLLLFLVLFCIPSLAEAQNTDSKIKIDIVKLINPERMIDNIRDFASPAFEGRELGTLGNIKATDWIKYNFNEIGIKPLPEFPDFEQKFSVKNYALGKSNVVRVGELELTSPDISPAIWGASTSITSELTTSSESVLGKIALVNIDTSINFNSDAYFTLLAKSKELVSKGAIGIIFYWTTDYNDGVNIYRFDDFVETPLLAEKNIINTSKPYINFEKLAIPILFTNYTYGKQLAQSNGLQIYIQSDFKVEFEREASNIIGYIPGKVKRLDKAIILLAELDQEGSNSVNGTPYLGANSNGSGIVTLLELARAVTAMKTKPTYSIIFVALNGSRRLNSGANSLFSNSDFTSLFKANTWIELHSTAYTFTEEDESHVNISVSSRLHHLRSLPYKITRRPKIEADIDTSNSNRAKHSFITNHILISADPSPYTNRVVDAQNKMNYVTFYRIAEITSDLVWRLANYNE